MIYLSKIASGKKFSILPTTILNHLLQIRTEDGLNKIPVHNSPFNEGQNFLLSGVSGSCSIVPVLMHPCSYSVVPERFT